MIAPDLATFRACAAGGALVPLVQRIFDDQLTPVLAYRRLVAPDERTAPSFLFESVERGERQGRHSILGARPSLEIIAHDRDVRIVDHDRGAEERRTHPNALLLVRELSQGSLASPLTLRDSERHGIHLPDAFRGGWVGYAGYDTVRWLEPGKLGFAAAAPDDRRLPDLHLALYRNVVVFDHVEKLAYVICNVAIDDSESLEAQYARGCAQVAALVAELGRNTVFLDAGSIDPELPARSTSAPRSSFTRTDFEHAVSRAKDYIHAGDAFQIVLSQRFERRTVADPFDIYRALRVVNPSPYMIYLQAQGAILVASSPEILCRVRDGTVTSRPLAGTRRRGDSRDEDRALEAELLADDKERAEHIMLVDLARNDLGRVCQPGTISLDSIMEVERYSHVMHISSTLSGRLRDGLTSWDALHAALPVGTVSGAPKVRAMQIIDELEPTRRGPYGGGIGSVSFDGSMDIALALRTMVIPTALRGDEGAWVVHVQAGAGIVAASRPDREYEETVNKAAALMRAIDLAERAFA